MRRELEKKIEKKSAELESLKMQVREAETRQREAEAYLQALKDMLKLAPADDESDESTEAQLRPGTDLAKARDAILDRGKPLYITDLLQAIGKEVNKANRVSLSGNMASYVRRGQIFTRPKPNTFGLIELGRGEKQDDDKIKSEGRSQPLEVVRSGVG